MRDRQEENTGNYVDTVTVAKSQTQEAYQSMCCCATGKGPEKNGTQETDSDHVENNMHLKTTE